MGLELNAAEVFGAAIKIEQNGATFYRKAAALQTDLQDRRMLERLAAMEDGHETTFIAMRKQLTSAEKAQTSYDPDNQSAQYLAALANLHGGEGSPRAADALTSEQSMADIVRTALELENKSILFYSGLRDLVPDKLGKDRVDEIMDEEKRHVVILSKALADLA